MSDTPNATAADAAAANALILSLIDLDAKAKTQGVSVIEILVQAARSQFGVDVRPAVRVPAEEVFDGAGETEAAADATAAELSADEARIAALEAAGNDTTAGA